MQMGSTCAIGKPMEAEDALQNLCVCERRSARREV